MPREPHVRVVRELARRGYNAERAAVTLLASAPDPERAAERAAAAAPEDAVVLRAEDVRPVLDGGRAPAADPPLSTGDSPPHSIDSGGSSPVEREGGPGAGGPGRTPGPVAVEGDVTGESTGTGTYGDFVSVFRDRYERLGGKLRSRVTHRPAEALRELSGGADAAMVGMVNDVRSTASGHRLVELEDSSGVFPCLVTADREVAALVEELLLDEVIAVEGTLSDDGGVLFVDAIHFPDVPRTFEPSTADRAVAAALVSDLHVGSREFLGDAWSRFAGWLHTAEAEHVEYLLIAGDLVEGVGVYPGQEDGLEVVDVYEQYERFGERLKEVPGDLEVVLIPGNHDAVRLAEPQPGFDDELREAMRAHDARIVGNPATVTLEGVSVLMYHGVSLDEVIAELPPGRASYGEPHRAMFHLLKKRHLAPRYGGRMRIAPEERDYLVIEEIPDVFHAGHVHKLGVGAYHGVRVINSGCWQSQTEFQRSVDIEPDPAMAPVLRLDTLEVTVHKFV